MALKWPSRAALGVALASTLCASVAAGQGVTVLAPQPTPAAAEIAPPVEPSAVVRRTVKLAEGTEIRMIFDEPLSSATSSAGDTFSISTDEDIRLSDGTVLRAGYRGKGEVTSAEKNGMMGKAGQLNIRLVYVRIGDQRVRLRANKGAEGKGAVTSVVVLSVLFGPLGFLKHGHNIKIPAGQSITAYVDEDTDLTVPVDPPPRG